MGSLSYIDLGIIAIYFIVILIVGFRSGRNIKTIEDYALANRSYKLIPLTLTFLATWISGASTIGNAANLFNDGIIAFLGITGTIIIFLLMTIFIPSKMFYFKDCISIGDMMGKMYGKNSKIITGLIGVIRETIAIGTLILALSFIGQLLPHINKNTIVLTSGLILILYSMKGGIRSVANTDIIQFGFLAVAIPLITTIILDKLGGINALLQQLPFEKTIIWNHPKFDYYLILFIVWALLPTSLATPVIMQRILMAKNTRYLQQMFLISIIILVLIKILTSFIGLGGYLLQPNLSANQIFPYLIQHILPPIFKGIAIAGMIAVIMSTADSCLNTASILIVHDILKPMNTTINELKIAKIATFLIGMISMIIAFYANNIIRVALYASGIIGATLMTPIVSGILGLKPSKKAFYVSLVVSILTLIIATYYLPVEKRYYVTLYCIITNSLSFFLVHFIDNGGRFIIDQERRRLEKENAKIDPPLFTFSWKSIQKTILTALPTPSNIVNYINYQMQNFGINYQLFVPVCLFNYMIIPLFFAPVPTTHYDYLFIVRFIGGMGCVWLLLTDFWPKQLLTYLPLYWHAIVLYCLPISGTLMYFLFNGHTFWSIYLCISLLFLSFIVDYKTFILFSILGILSGMGIHTLCIDAHYASIEALIYIIIICLFIGIVIARDKEKSIQEKLNLKDKMINLKDQMIQDKHRMAGMISHDMRDMLQHFATPIELLSGDLQYNPKKPILYKKDQYLISKSLYDQINKTIQDSNIASQKASQFIDMMQTVISKGIHNAYDIGYYSCKDCVEKAISSFHFNEPSQKDKITLNLKDNFTMYISYELFKHIIFNLIKNTYKYAGSDSAIEIKLFKNNQLSFKDNGEGIPDNKLKRIFEPDYTTNGTGLGLTFCKKIMNEFNGDIVCHSNYHKDSKEGKSSFCEFILTFPRVEKIIKHQITKIFVKT